MKKSATTRACIFATRHSESRKFSWIIWKRPGSFSFVGKINMDRNAPEELRRTAFVGGRYRLAGKCRGKIRARVPVLTPRFIPSCTDELMRSLAEIRREYALPVQSHLSENQDEVAWVKELCPEAQFYGDAYQEVRPLRRRGENSHGSLCLFLYAGDGTDER